MIQRLSRLDRIYTDQLFYFLTFCTHARRTILANPAIHDSLRSFCTTAETHHILVGRYVIMPDHIHLFASFQEQEQLSPWMKSLKGVLSKTLREAGHSAPIWQKGFFDYLLRREDSYGPNGNTSNKIPSAKISLLIPYLGHTKAR